MDEVTKICHCYMPQSIKYDRNFKFERIRIISGYKLTVSLSSDNILLLVEKEKFCIRIDGNIATPVVTIFCVFQFVATNNYDAVVKLDVSTMFYAL